MGLKERPVSELSLGLTNILYISLMLLLLKDKTIIPVIKAELFELLLEKDQTGLLNRLYQKSENDNYILMKGLEGEYWDSLYKFMDEYNFRHQSFTILAVEEPEAHLHPILQRLIYREVLHNSNTSVIFTTHSTHIASVTPLNSIVHIRNINDSSKVYSTVNMAINIKDEKDIERYIDAKRGEIYLGKGIILVEGITEEYFVPAAGNLLNTPLDDYGIVVCNVDSTNFKPYIQLLNTLNIPWILFSDGDCYEIEEFTDANGETKQKRHYHVKVSESEKKYGFRGDENICNILTALGIIEMEIGEEELKEKGCFIGYYTLEVDMMEKADKNGIQLLKNIYNELKSGGEEMQANFEKALDDEDYWLALKRIDSNISKGRFSQRLASELTTDLIPDYIVEGIKSIVQKVKNSYEQPVFQ